jgi:PadR family transcriptional regulator PadR
MDRDNAAVIRGTLEVMILRCLSLQELHGLGLCRRIEQMTKETFEVKAGSLFPALHRLERKGLISRYWGTSESNRKARFYRITAVGRRQLEIETARWNEVSVAISEALGTA